LKLASNYAPVLILKNEQALQYTADE